MKCAWVGGSQCGGGGGGGSVGGGGRQAGRQAGWQDVVGVLEGTRMCPCQREAI